MAVGTMNDNINYTAVLRIGYFSVEMALILAGRCRSLPLNSPMYSGSPDSVGENSPTHGRALFLAAEASFAGVNTTRQITRRV